MIARLFCRLGMHGWTYYDFKKVPFRRRCDDCGKEQKYVLTPMRKGSGWEND